jgi:hypothetical protein
MKIADEILSFTEAQEEKIAKKYFQLRKKLAGEKQFNKKVDLNKKVLAFVKQNKITIDEEFPIIHVYVDKVLFGIIHQNELASKYWFEAVDEKDRASKSNKK